MFTILNKAGLRLALAAMVLLALTGAAHRLPDLLPETATQVGATLVVGAHDSLPGREVSVSVSLDTRGVIARSVQINLSYNGTALPKAEGIKGVGFPAGWSFSANSPTPGDLRFIAFDLLGVGAPLSGEIFSALLTVDTAATGSLAITVALEEVLDQGNKKIVVAVTNGSVNIVTPTLRSVCFSNWKWNERMIQWEPPAMAVMLGAIDLRSLPQMALKGTAEGFGIFSYANVPAAGCLALTGDRNLTPDEKTTIRTKLGKVIAADRFGLAVFELLTTHSDPTGLTFAKPLLPTIQGNLEVHLGGFPLLYQERFDINTSPQRNKVLAVLQADYARLRQESFPAYQPGDPRRQHYLKVLGGWMRKYGVDDHRIFLPQEVPDEGWLPPASIFGDTFVEATTDTTLASHTPTGPNAGTAWSLFDGGGSAIVRQATDRAEFDGASNNSVSYRMQNNLASDDHYAEASVDASSDGAVDGPEVGTLVRKDASATITHYFGLADFTEDRFALNKYVNGTLTEIGSLAETITAGTPFILRTEANGSTIRVLRDGTQKISVTDTSITGKLRGGIFGWTNNSAHFPIWDDFEKADLAATQIIIID